MTRALRAATLLSGSTECRDASRLLTWLRRRPDSPRSHIANALSMSADTCQRTLAAMIGAGLVEVARVERGVQLWRCAE
jgi:DNA-binding IclR family transcriptional regulator